MAQTDFSDISVHKYDIIEYDERFRHQVISLWHDNFDNASYPIFTRDIEVAVKRKPSLFFIAVREKKLLGTCVGANDGHRCWVYYLCVEKNERRAKIGSSLLRRLEIAFQEEGHTQLGLHVRKNSHDAVNFYHKQNYFVEDTICMGKRFDT